MERGLQIGLKEFHKVFFRFKEIAVRTEITKSHFAKFALSYKYLDLC